MIQAERMSYTRQVQWPCHIINACNIQGWQGRSGEFQEDFLLEGRDQYFSMISCLKGAFAESWIKTKRQELIPGTLTEGQDLQVMVYPAASQHSPQLHKEYEIGKIKVI